MNRLFLSCWLLVNLTLSNVDLGWSQPAIVPDPTAPKTEEPAHHPVRLPIRLYWGYLVIVEGSIGGFQKLSFLVDTGAYPSVIDRKIALKLGLAEQPSRVNLQNKSVQTGLVILPSLLLGPVRVESLPVLTEDLSFLRKALGYKVDAIIGLDVLGKSSFTVNYITKEMLLGPVESLPFSALFDTDVPIVTIRTKFQNQHLRLVVDTGGPDLMLFQSRMPDSTALQTLGTEETANLSGTVRLRKVRIPEVYLGEEAVGPQTVFVVDDRKDDGDNFDGVLGMRGPQFSKIAFDFEHRSFSWDLQSVAPAITVAIYDDVHLSQQVLADAEDEAARVYQKAGVALSWIECKSSKTDVEPDLRCQDPSSTTHLSLRIIPHASKSGEAFLASHFSLQKGRGLTATYSTTRSRNWTGTGMSAWREY